MEQYNGTVDSAVHECNDNVTITVLHPVDMAMLAVYIPSSILNTMVIIFAWQLNSRTDSVSHIMIGAIACGDLIVTSLGGPPELIVRHNWFTGSWFLCRFIHFANWLGLAVSGFFLTLLNLEKLAYFRWPLRYPNVVTHARVVYTVVGVWILCVLYVGVVMFYPGIVELRTEKCEHSNIQPVWLYDIFLHLFCILPLISSAILSLYLFGLTRKLRATDNNTSSVKRKLRATVFIFATTFWTAISLLPFRLYSILRLHYLRSDTINGCAWTYAAWFMLYLLMLSPVVNPVITTSIYVPYRSKMRDCLAFYPRALRRRSNGSTITGEHSRSTNVPLLSANDRRRITLDDVPQIEQDKNCNREAIAENGF